MPVALSSLLSLYFYLLSFLLTSFHLLYSFLFVSWFLSLPVCLSVAVQRG
jgi:hypothetical protein